MPNSEHQDFQGRLLQVLKNRKRYPWAAGLKISRGTTNRLFKGEIPGYDTLGVIMRAENVSITWLTEGAGPPYLVSTFPIDEHCRDYLDGLLQMQDWTVHLLTDGGRVRVLVLYGPGEVDYRDQPVPYTAIEVVTGAGRATLARVASMPHRFTLADTDTVAAVASGARAGTWELLGDDGLLNIYQELEPTELKVAEPSDAAYGEEETDATSAEERQWIELIRQLDPDYRVRLKEVGHAFVAARHHRRDTGNDGED